MAAMEAVAAGGGAGTAHRTPVRSHWQASMAAMEAGSGGGQAQLIVPRCGRTGRHLWQLWKLWQLGGGGRHSSSYPGAVALAGIYGSYGSCGSWGGGRHRGYCTSRGSHCTPVETGVGERWKPGQVEAGAGGSRGRWKLGKALSFGKALSLGRALEHGARAWHYVRALV